MGRERAYRLAGGVDAGSNGPMSLFRFVARTMLASYFVVNGIKAVRHPEDFTEIAQPVVDKVLPRVAAVLPDEAAGFLPEETTGVARTCGAVQIAGGLALATGLGRRLGAGALAATMLPAILTNNPWKAARDERAKFGADVALLGGTILAALDTEGEPDLGWRIRARRELTQSARARRKNAQGRRSPNTGEGHRS